MALTPAQLSVIANNGGKISTPMQAQLNGYTSGAPYISPDQLTTVNNEHAANVGLVGAGGAGGTAAPTSAQTDPLLASIAQLDTILNNKNQQSTDEYNRAIDSYNANDTIDAQNHDQGVQSNEQTYTGNNQAALLNAANASTGLRAVLASLHALGGSGMDIVKDLVGKAANSDTGASRQTFEGNARALSSAWQTALQQEKQRREDANATLENNKQNNQSTVLTSRQGILQSLASLWGADTSQGKGYASEAASLAPDIAATTRATVAPYATPSLLYSPAATATYLAGTKNLNVNTSGNSASTSPINAPGYVPVKKDTSLAGVA